MKLLVFAVGFVAVIGASLGALGAHSGRPLTAGASPPVAFGARGLSSAVPNTIIATISNVISPLQATWDPTNDEFYVPSDSSNLVVVSGHSNQVIANLTFGAFANVQSPTYAAGSHEIYVPDDLGVPDLISVVNTTSNSIVANISLGDSAIPATGAYDPANGEIYFPDEGTANPLATIDNVTVISTLTNEVVTTLAVGLDPQTPVFDPADGDIYVPNEGSNNLSIISGATDTVVGAISGLNYLAPGYLYTPVYDPVNRDVYAPDPNGSNLTVISGTASIGSVAVGQDPESPGVDNVSGNVYVTDTNGNVSVISPTTNQVIATNSNVGGYEGPVFDWVDDEMYVPGVLIVSTGEVGTVTALNPTTGATLAVVTVGDSPSTPTFDTVDDELYSPSFDDDNISVIAAGTAPTVSPPGTYSVTFTVSGLPSGTSWSVDFNGTTRFASAPASLVFPAFPNGTYDYSISDSYTDYLLQSPAPFGTESVHGAGVTQAVVFVSFNGLGGGAPFLGLSLLLGAVVVSAVIIVVVIVVVVVLVTRSPPRPPPVAPGPGYGGGPGLPPPAYYPPPPPPPPPPLR